MLKTIRMRESASSAVIVSGQSSGNESRFQPVVRDGVADETWWYGFPGASAMIRTSWYVESPPQIGAPGSTYRSRSSEAYPPHTAGAKPDRLSTRSFHPAGVVKLALTLAPPCEIAAASPVFTL